MKKSSGKKHKNQAINTVEKTPEKHEPKIMPSMMVHGRIRSSPFPPPEELAQYKSIDYADDIIEMTGKEQVARFENSKRESNRKLWKTVTPLITNLAFAFVLGMGIVYGRPWETMLMVITLPTIGLAVSGTLNWKSSSDKDETTKEK